MIQNDNPSFQSNEVALDAIGTGLREEKFEVFAFQESSIKYLEATPERKIEIKAERTKPKMKSGRKSIKVSRFIKEYGNISGREYKKIKKGSKS